eukprot:scaffold28986_cov58-Phaeocystis_antarctica.AAC.1
MICRSPPRAAATFSLALRVWPGLGGVRRPRRYAASRRFGTIFPLFRQLSTVESRGALDHRLHHGSS